MFFVVIQLGAILAVVILFWEKMWPFQRKTPTQPAVRWDTIPDVVQGGGGLYPWGGGDHPV